jgi:hypothetical protein
MAKTQHKVQTYMQDLEQQIKENKKRKERDRQIAKQPGWTGAPEEKVLAMADCEGCYNKFPKGWLELYDCQQDL